MHHAASSPHSSRVPGLIGLIALLSVVSVGDSAVLTVNECVHGALRCTGIAYGMYSCLIPSVPSIDLGSTAILTLKMNDQPLSHQAFLD